MAGAFRPQVLATPRVTGGEASGSTRRVYITSESEKHSPANNKCSKKGGSFSEASPLGLAAASCFSGVGSNGTEIFSTRVLLHAVLTAESAGSAGFFGEGQHWTVALAGAHLSGVTARARFGANCGFWTEYGRTGLATDPLR
jgi:hypothetical protein